MHEWKQKIKNKYTTTWAIQDGDIRRQIDYIMNNANRRNNERAASTKPNWRAAMNKNQQQRE